MFKQYIYSQCIILFLMMFLCPKFSYGYDFSEVNEDGKIIYYENRGSLFVSSGDKPYTGIINIPDSVGTYVVDGISTNAFSNTDALVGVNLPKTIRYVRTNAFKNSSVEFINFDNTDRETSKVNVVIEDSAFVNCKSLTNFEFPKRTYELCNGLFDGSKNLSSIVYPEVIAKGNSSAEKDINWFLGDAPVSKIVMPYDNIFDSGKNLGFLGKVFLGYEKYFDRYDNHDKYDFYFPTSVKTVELFSNGAISLNNYLFYYYSYKYSSDYYIVHYEDIQSVSLNADSIMSINLTDCNWKNNDWHALTFDEFNLKANLLGKALFNNSMRKLTLPFAGAGTAENHDVFSSLFSGSIPATLESVELAEGATKIIANAFRDCSNIKELILPSTMRGLGENALYGCSGIENIYVHSIYPPGAYDNTFDGISQFQCVLHVPEGSKQYYANADGWKRFYQIVEEADDDDSSIYDVEATDEVGIDEYYTISGIKVNANSLKRGLYIHRNGYKSEKIFIP